MERDSGLAAFGQRLQEACDRSADAPAFNHGRLRWLVEALAGREIRISVETARRWVAGETRPRPNKMKALAEVLGVDEAWLALGEANPERPVAPAGRFSENPLVNLAIGFIQLEGGSCALPEEGEGVDLYAIINGRKLDLCFAHGEVDENGSVAFPTPRVTRGCRVIGGVIRARCNVEFYDLTEWCQGSARLTAAKHRHGELRLEGLSAGGYVLKCISEFVDLRNR